MNSISSTSKMKRSYENLISIIPFDAFGIVHQYLSPKDKGALCQINKAFLKECSELAKSICFLPPKTFSEAPENIYERLIKRYPNIRKLTFRSRYRCGSKESYEKQIHDLIDFLNTHKGKHPLSHVKEMDIEEIEWHQRLCIHSSDPNNATYMDHVRKINKAFLSALSHANLQSISWSAYQVSTVLRWQEIQPILEKALDLKYLKFDSPLHEEINLSFEKQSQLVDALFEPRGDAGPKTINTLGKCQKLETLIAGYSNLQNVKDAYKTNFWNLKRLTITTPLISCDLSFTKQMPNLKYLRIYGSLLLDKSKITDLGINCPSLEMLHMGRLNLNEEDLAIAFQGFSNLELLIFDEPNQLTIKIWESFKAILPKIDAYNYQAIYPWNKQWTFYSSANPLPEL